MSDPFVGEIKMFGGNFAPRGFAMCDGQLLAVNQNDALFSLLGTIYGGDGRTTFGLPDLRGRVPINWGTGPGLLPIRLGQTIGTETNTLTTTQVPTHTHEMTGTSNPAGDSSPEDNLPATLAGVNLYRSDGSGLASMDEDMLAENTNGGNQSHNNVMPFLCIHFIIALIGIYPSRT